MKKRFAPAAFQETSSNHKLAPIGREDVKDSQGKRVVRFKAIGPYISTTYVSITATCTDACPFKGHGCYVDAGFTGPLSRALNDAAKGWTPDAVIGDEISMVDAAFGGGDIPQDGARGGRDLRFHIGGDCPSVWAAEKLGQLAERWRRRGGGSVFTYTHNWRTIPRFRWGSAISVLASIEKPEQIVEVQRQGYPPALVVDVFPSGRKSFKVPGSDVKFIPCPAQTRDDTTCVDCRLCMDRDLLAMGAGIAFEAHGRDKKKVSEAVYSKQLELPAVPARARRSPALKAV